MTGEAGAAVPDWLGALIALIVTFALLGLRAWLFWVGRVGDESDDTPPVLAHRVWRRTGGTDTAGLPAPPPGSAAILAPQKDGHDLPARQWWERARGRETRPHE